jgi:hypothetical protein
VAGRQQQPAWRAWGRGHRGSCVSVLRRACGGCRASWTQTKLTGRCGKDRCEEAAADSARPAAEAVQGVPSREGCALQAAQASGLRYGGAGGCEGCKLRTLGMFGTTSGCCVAQSCCPGPCRAGLGLHAFRPAPPRRVHLRHVHMAVRPRTATPARHGTGFTHITRSTPRSRQRLLEDVDEHGEKPQREQRGRVGPHGRLVDLRTGAAQATAAQSASGRHTRVQQRQPAGRPRVGSIPGLAFMRYGECRSGPWKPRTSMA